MIRYSYLLDGCLAGILFAIFSVSPAGVRTGIASPASAGAHETCIGVNQEEHEPVLTVPEPPSGKAGKHPSILLFTLDTTRADALGCHGAAGDPTPVLDSLAARGIRFTNAFAPCPITLPSHATLFTGLYPPEHGLRDNSPRALSPAIPVVTEAFRKKGYNTAAFVSGETVGRKWGLNRGFLLYNDATVRRSGPPLSPPERQGGDTVRIAGKWLEAVLKSEEPFFLWVHLFDPHDPYVAPESFARKFPDSPYTAEVAYADDCVGRVLKILEDRDRLDSTVVIATSDHGEGLGEHNEQTHTHLIHGSTIHVPLIISWPDRWRKGHLIQEPVGLVDLAPTLYHLLDQKPPRTSGISLLRTLTGEEKTPSQRPLYAESLYDFFHFGWAPLYSIRLGSRYLIQADSVVHLYDLEEDRHELRNLARVNPGAVRPLRIQLARMRASFYTPPPGQDKILNAPPGYLQAPHAGPILKKDRSLVGKRRIPMEAVGDTVAFEQVKRLSFVRTEASQKKALDHLRILRKRDPQNPSYLYWAGRTHRNLAVFLVSSQEKQVKHLEEAKRYFTAVLNRRPLHIGAQNLLFQCFLLLNDPEPVIKGTEKIIEEGYENKDTRAFLASAFLTQSSCFDLDRADRENKEGLRRYPGCKLLMAQRKKIDQLLLKRAVERRRKGKQ